VVNLAGTGWDRERAATLQLEAARHLLTFITLLRVTNADGVGKARVKVEVPDSGLADRRPATLHLGDGQGWVVLPPLRRDRRHHLVVIESGRRRSLWVTAPKAPVLRTTLRLGVPPRPVASGSSTPTRVYSDGVTFVNEAIPLNKVRDGEVFEVIMTDKGFDLVGVASSVHSGVAVTRVATLPSDALPGTIRPASFVTFADGVWRRSSVAEKRKALKSRGGALRERLLP
jgi:hypothetical protein